MLFVNIFLARLKYLEDDKHENYFIVSIVGHMKNGFPVSKSKITRDPGLFMTSSKNSYIWNTLKSFRSWWCAVFIEGFSSRHLTVDVNFITTSWCKAEEYAECFVSCDQEPLLNGCDFYFCGINPIDRLKLFWKLVCLLFLGKTTMPNIGAFLKCHKMSQKNDDNFPHITSSSGRGHMIWHLWRSEYSVPS